MPPPPPVLINITISHDALDFSDIDAKVLILIIKGLEMVWDARVRCQESSVSGKVGALSDREAN